MLCPNMTVLRASLARNTPEALVCRVQDGDNWLTPLKDWPPSLSDDIPTRPSFSLPVLSGPPDSSARLAIAIGHQHRRQEPRDQGAVGVRHQK